MAAVATVLQTRSRMWTVTEAVVLVGRQEKQNGTSGTDFALLTGAFFLKTVHLQK